MSQPQTRMETFESLKAKLSKNELKYQFVKWERSLPKSFLPAQKRKLVLTVKNALGLDVSSNAPASSSCESMDGGGDEIIDLLGIDLGYSLRVICPPVAECALCEKRLANRAGSAIQIVVHDVSGPSVWSKFS